MFETSLLENTCEIFGRRLSVDSPDLLKRPALPQVLSDARVFFDFDNTITTLDVLDEIIKRFSADDAWVALEKEWEAGRIGSHACLKGQLRSVRVTKEALVKYLATIKIDPGFKKLLVLLRKEGVKPVIVSDSFSFIIKKILENNGIRGLKIYANNLRFDKDRVIPLFPHAHRSGLRCANCKKLHLLNHGPRHKMSIYIGDGISDICPAEHADFVFAKGALLEYLTHKKIKCSGFASLGDIYRYFKEVYCGTKT